MMADVSTGKSPFPIMAAEFGQPIPDPADLPVAKPATTQPRYIRAELTAILAEKRTVVLSADIVKVCADALMRHPLSLRFEGFAEELAEDLLYAIATRGPR